MVVLSGENSLGLLGGDGTCLKEDHISHASNKLLVSWVGLAVWWF